MKHSELERKLRRAGCYQVGAARHPFWYSPITGETFTTGHHKTEDVRHGTLKSIKEHSGVDL